MTIGGKTYRVNLFDTVRTSCSPSTLRANPPQAGQERFRTLSTSFYRGSHGILLMYDISNRATFLAMERWFLEAETNTTEDIALHLVCSRQPLTSRGILTKAQTGRHQARQGHPRPRGLDGRGPRARRGARRALLRGQLADKAEREEAVCGCHQPDHADAGAGGEYSGRAAAGDGHGWG